MSATTEFPTFPQDDAAALPARLRLKDVHDAPGALDGAWWPRSRDLPAELPALAAAMESRRDRVTRAAVNHRNWPAVPRKVAVAGHVIKVGWFADELDPHKILLLSYRVGRWDLLVIPPQTGAAAAERLMAAASDAAAPPRTASALMAEEEHRPGTAAAGRPENPQQTWDDEGGATPPAPRPSHSRAEPAA